MEGISVLACSILSFDTFGITFSNRILTVSFCRSAAPTKMLYEACVPMPMRQCWQQWVSSFSLLSSASGVLPDVYRAFQYIIFETKTSETRSLIPQMLSEQNVSENE